MNDRPGTATVFRIAFVTPDEQLSSRDAVLVPNVNARELRTEEAVWLGTARAWYASDKCRPETRELYGPTPSRTRLVQLFISERPVFGPGKDTDA